MTRTKIQQKSCAFTGHRPHKFPWRYNELDERCIALKTKLAQEVAKLVQSGVTDFYSGMADGSDIWLSQIVLDLRKENPALKLHCVLPCENQAEKWSNSAQERYQIILNQADSVTYVSKRYRDGCMLERNRLLVELTEILLAVYNHNRRSGTASTINYARKCGRKLVIVDPAALHTAYENF